MTTKDTTAISRAAVIHAVTAEMINQVVPGEQTFMDIGAEKWKQCGYGLFDKDYKLVSAIIFYDTERAQAVADDYNRFYKQGGYHVRPLSYAAE